MWDPFTKEAREVFETASLCASKEKTFSIGTHYLLCGLFVDSDIVELFSKLEIHAKDIKNKTREIMRHHDLEETENYLSAVFSNQSKRVIELAFEEARKLNNNYVDSHHILLALLNEELKETSVAGIALCDLDILYDTVYTTLIKANLEKQNLRPSQLSFILEKIIEQNKKLQTSYEELIKLAKETKFSLDD